MELTLTKHEIESYAEWLGKYTEELNDDDCVKIVADALDIEDEKIESAERTEIDENGVDIYYTIKEEDDGDEDEKPAWNEKYLNTLGMSLKDF